jgi:hypothetical protein
MVMQPPEGKNGGHFPRDKWGKVLQDLLADQTEQNIALFNNSKFGRAGYRAEELIQKLSPKLPPVDTGVSYYPAPGVADYVFLHRPPQ